MNYFKCLLLIICSLFVYNIDAQSLKVDNDYYEPELLMVSQPKMEFYYANDYDYVKLYFDVKNIGSDTYKGDFVILLEPDTEHYYAKKRITVKPGKIKRIKLEIDLNQIYYDSTYTVMPVYEYDNQWYPLTMYEQFTTLSLHVNAPHCELRARHRHLLLLRRASASPLCLRLLLYNSSRRLGIRLWL